MGGSAPFYYSNKILINENYINHTYNYVSMVQIDLEVESIISLKQSGSMNEEKFIETIKMFKSEQLIDYIVKFSEQLPVELEDELDSEEDEDGRKDSELEY
jgi:hypothetical protein